MYPMFLLSLRQLTGRWRLLLILLLAALPVALAVLISTLANGEDAYETNFINTLLDGMLVGGILPIVMMVLATAAFGNELEDRTLSYLVLKPVPRPLIVLPKLLASIVVSGPLLVASGFATALLGLGGGGQAGVAVGAALLAGVIAYGAIFTWAGLMSTRALAFGLIYVFLWESLISRYLVGIRYLSVRAYTMSILHGIDEKSFDAVLGNRVIEFPTAIVGAAAVTVVFFWLTVRRLSSMDVP